MQATSPSDGGGARDGWRLSHPFRRARPKLLLVEGQDEWHLLIRLLERLGIANVDVRSFEGKDNLANTLVTLASGSASGLDVIEDLAVWRDAEGDAGGAQDAVEGALRGSGFAVPGRPGEFVPGSPGVAYLVLPPGVEQGCLEDVLLASIAKGAEALPCIDQFCQCLRGKEREALLSPHPNDSKIKLHAYLCSLEDPTTLIGQAADQGVWNFTHEAWKPLLQFLSNLSQHG